MFISLADSKPKINFTAIEFFIGRALLRGRKAARWWGIFYTCIVIILFSVFIILFFIDGGSPVIKFAGKKIMELPAIFEFFYLTIALVISIWQLSVLHKKEVTALFNRAGSGS